MHSHKYDKLYHFTKQISINFLLAKYLKLCDNLTYKYKKFKFKNGGLKMNDRIVITVIGADKTGIVANVSTKLSELNLNIIDITQKVFEDDIFAMIMLVEAPKNTDIKKLQEEFKVFEDKIGVRVYLQHENIFKAMHRI